MQDNYHFIGIGGVGMGALASLLLRQGLSVSGSDVVENIIIRKLKDYGARIAIGHKVSNVLDGTTKVIFSSAIKADNPELCYAKAKGLETMHRAELLAQLMENHEAITIAGAHGKTTTAAMLATVFWEAKLNPTVAVGGMIKGREDKVTLGDGKYFIAEVDESDGSFLLFKSKYAIMTNIDFEHVDHYKNWENILNAYSKFLSNFSKNGLGFACAEDKILIDLVKKSGVEFLTYGFDSGCDLFAQSICCEGTHVSFDCNMKGERLGRIDLNVPGKHNILNALGVIGLARHFSIDFGVIQKALAGFMGAYRRFQIKGEIQNILVIDDYAHHPTEIRAVLSVLPNLNRKRIITIFQPHRFSRTQALMDGFVDSLKSCQDLIVTDIYSASESVIDGVTAEVLCERLKVAGNSDVKYLPKEEILDYLQSRVKEGDCILTLGAGDLYQIGERFLDAIKEPV